MSRSYKAPVVKQRQHKKDKRLAERRVRRQKDDIADGKVYRKYSNSYDICDWGWWTGKESDKRK